MLETLKPTFSKAGNCTTGVPTWIFNYFWSLKKKPQLVPNRGKHRAKQELETVPPQELGTVPPLRGKK